VASSRFSFGEFQRGIGAKLLIAPFGASCVLVFAIPQSHLAQPRNVIGGHLISAGAGLSVFCARAGSGSAVSMAGVAKIVAPKGGGKARIREAMLKRCIKR
jgi:CBS-domain-containing membrane protein